MQRAYQEAINQELAYFSELRRRLDELGGRNSNTAKQLYGLLGAVYAQGYAALTAYMQDLQQLSDAMQGIVALQPHQEAIIRSFPQEKRNAVLYVLGVNRAMQRPSLAVRAAMIAPKLQVMEALLNANPQQSGVSSEQYHADLEAYGKYLIEFDECFMVTTTEQLGSFPWLSLGAGAIGGYVLKDAIGNKGLSGIFSSFFGKSEKE